MPAMEIRLHEIPPEGLELAFKLAPAALGLHEAGVGCEVPVSVQLSVIKGEGVVFATGRIQSQLVLQCVRCLKATPFKLNVGVQAEYVASEALGGKEEHELTRKELDMVFYSGDSILFDDLIREQVLLTIPTYPLCRPDCRGLCARCGQDLNESDCGCRRSEPDPRFAVLKDYFKKDRR